MAIRWSEIHSGPNVSQAREDARRQINASNYGPDGWTVQEIVDLPKGDPQRLLALEILHGERAGKRSGVAVDSPVRLRVTSRQACVRDAEGNAIGETRTLRQRSIDGRPAPYYAPISRHDEAPQPGDIVAVKGARREARGPYLTRAQRKRWELEGTPRHEMMEYPVDDVGCITVPAPVAVRLLDRHGPRAIPATQRQGKGWVPDGEVTNRRFVEVFDDGGSNSGENPRRSKASR